MDKTSYVLKKLELRKERFLNPGSARGALVVNIILAAAYFYVMAFFFPRGNEYLYWILIVGQAFHTWQAFTYIHTIWDTGFQSKRDKNYLPPVDVFITVAGEPAAIVEETVRAALAMDYPNFKVYILNDGYVAKRDNWQESVAIAHKLGVECITRKIPGGAKAGNINNALTLSSNPFVAIFDADHVPHADFLRETMQYFSDEKVAFVQTPQYYRNYTRNYLTRGAWEQQELFFGAILRGKNRMNAVTMCGTNMVIRREPLLATGGMCDTNIAEDFVTGLFIHQKGWKSVYVPKVLAEGLAPEDFLSYYKQQFRWARGSLEVLFRHNPFFKRGLTMSQRMQYLASASYYFGGVIVLLYALIPLVFLYTGLVPFYTSTMELALVFLPYIFLTFHVLQRSSNWTYTFRALAFSMASFPIHIKALWAVLTGQKSAFNVTSKLKLEGNFLHLVIPHLAYIVAVCFGIGIGFMREGLSPSLVTNVSWALFNVAVFIPFIRAASPKHATRSRPIEMPAVVMRKQSVIS